jgi:diguanylate cyclase (GGDEF)-like protein
MTRLLRAIPLVIVALCTTGAWSADQKVTLQLRWTPQFQFAGYYVALEKGFYKEEGLDVHVIPGEGNRTQVLEEVISGRADFGIGNSGLALAALKGDKVTVLADIFQRSASVLIVKPGVEGSIPKLGQKNLAMRSLKDNPELYAIFQRYGLSPDQLPNLAASKYDLDAFVKGDCVAINGYLSNEPYLLKEKGVPFNLIDPVDYGINFYGDAIFTRSGYMANNPDTVKAFVRASIRGWKYALDHKEEAIALLQAGPAKHLSRARLEFEANAIEKLIMAEVIPLGEVNHERWERIAATFKTLGLANSTADLPAEFFMSYWIDRGTKYKFMLYGTGLAVLLVVLLVAYAWQRKTSARLSELVKEKEALLSRVEQLVNHDYLTGLPNRRLLEERLDRAIAHALRHGTQFAVCYIDLNDFKYVNDTMGHEGGDQVLIYVSTVLQRTVRDADTVARVGGDEFVILLDSVISEVDIQTLDSRLREAFERPFVYKDQSAMIGFSLGYAIFPTHGQTADILVQVADIAMYQTKAQ